MNAPGYEKTSYKFGALEFVVKGLGVFFGGEKLDAKVAALSTDQLQTANREAWKLRRSSERAMDRYSNVTIHGHTNYDNAHLDYMVAKAVCSATWKFMRAAA